MKTSLTLAAAAAPLLFTQCANIRQTINVEGHIFVKIPKISRDFKNCDVTIPIAAPGAPGRGPTEETWFFTPVVQGPRYKQYTGEWYMAYTADKKKSVVSKGIFTGRGWGRVKALTPEIAQATHAAFGVWPTVIEPGQVFRTKSRNPAPPLKEPEKKLTITKYPDRAWASVKSGDKYDPLWHLNDEYSQLRRAREMVRKETGSAGGGLTVAILDTGYDARLRHGLPKNLAADSAERDAYQRLQVHGKSNWLLPGQYGESHGSKTMSVLAGSRIRICGDTKQIGCNEELGGIPDARIVPYRIAPWVASPTTANLAYAIDHASRVEKADVISMSHGGAPTMMWMDAVNAAMDRGTAMVAATGDYVNLPFFNAGIGTPAASVYPAACRRVLAAGGVTASGKSYAKTDWSRFPFSLKAFVRASYGPDGWHWHWNKSTHEDWKKRDQSQVQRLGLHHIYPVNGYAPNVLALPPARKNGTRADRAELHFGGASASTPQVAAAAALWIAYYEKELRAAGLWNSWEKPQMAYLALLHSAHRPEGTEWPDVYLGAGNLRAAEALKLTPKFIRSLKGDLLHWPNRPRNWPVHDIYSGDNGLKRIVKLGLPTFYELNEPPGDHSSRLPLQREDGTFPDGYESSLQTVYENQILSRAWLHGRPTLNNKGVQEEKPPVLKRILQFVMRRGPVKEKHVREKASKWTAASPRIIR
jgi:Subtilase family